MRATKKRDSIFWDHKRCNRCKWLKKKPFPVCMLPPGKPCTQYIYKSA